MFRVTCYNRSLNNYGGLDALIQVYAPRYGVELNLARAVAAQESCFNPATAASSANAVGPMQVLPSTAAGMNNDSSAPPEVRSASVFTIEGNVILGCYYLSQQLNRFGSYEAALAAYNAGPGRVQSALAQAGTEGFLALMPRETRDYVPSVMSYYQALSGQEPPVDDYPVVGTAIDFLEGIIDKIQGFTGWSRDASTAVLAFTGVFFVVGLLGIIAGSGRR